MSTDTPKTWFITGVSTGFGRAFAVEALERGDTVAGTLRDEDQIAAFEALAPGRAFAFRMDVTDAASVRRAVADAETALGRIDVLVNNAGYGVVGGIEEIDQDQTRRQMEVNFFGALEVTRAALPAMRARRAGHIVNVSSVGGVAAYAGFGIYNASKFALEAISEALSKEVGALGIAVTIVEPGAFRTDWAGRSMDQGTAMDDYADTAGQTVAWARGALDGNQQGDPAKAAALLADVVAMDAPPLRLPMGGDAVDGIRAKLEAQLAELAQWEEKARGLDFDGLDDAPTPIGDLEGRAA
jgi:NAD(P)-dependent dehydrogenase (short-subunit alcohol dehydrogenase family)